MEKKKEKEVAKTELLKLIIDHLCIAPTTQIEHGVKNKCIHFKEIKHTPKEIFEFIQSISEEPLSNISQFVQEYCNLNEHYLKPE